MMVEKSGAKSDGNMAAKLASVTALRKKVPTFRRQEAHRRKRLTKSGWRAPRGAQSKLRRYHKSKGALVRVGYRLPKALRGLHKSGKESICVTTVSELEKLDKTKYIVIIGSKVGMKKRIELVRQASKLGLEIQNLDAKTYEATAKKRLDARKAKRSARVAKKAKKAKKAEKKAEKKVAKKDEEKIEQKKEASKKNEQKTPVKEDVKKTTNAEPKASTVSKKTEKPKTTQTQAFATRENAKAFSGPRKSERFSLEPQTPAASKETESKQASNLSSAELKTASTHSENASVSGSSSKAKASEKVPVKEVVKEEKALEKQTSLKAKELQKSSTFDTSGKEEVKK